MMQGCNQSVYTCLRFENYRGLGWEVSKSRAKDILHEANKKGLMQTAEVSLTEEGAIRGAICNCCADCCVHPDLTGRYDAVKVWPLARYVAQHLTDRCTSCGLCVRRCPFNAFADEKSQPGPAGNPTSTVKKQKNIHLDENLCRGCGVCSTGCPDEAIRMVALDTCQSDYSLVTRLGCGPVSMPGNNNS
jgi:Pyruvate/2-oxoacid:ferredoxin oxidoreductase delta subunit